MYENMKFATPSSGPIITIKYVIPKSGINTTNALVAFLYWCTSPVVADLNLVIRTWNRRLFVMLVI